MDLENDVILVIKEQQPDTISPFHESSLSVLK